MELHGGIIGVGQVVCEYAWPGYRASDTDICIDRIGNLHDREGTVRELEKRMEVSSRERESIEDILRCIDDGTTTVHQAGGNGFQDDTFFKGLDFVYLATPNWIRKGFVEQAARAGVAMILEKPIGHDAPTARYVADMLHNVRAICAEHYSYKSPSLWMFEEIPEMGAIERIECCLEEPDFLEAERYQWLFDRDKSGGGIWLDTGIHMMHLINLAGARASSTIDAYGYSHPFASSDPRANHINGEVAAHVRVSLESGEKNVMPGAEAEIYVAKCMPKAQKYFRITYEQGKVLLDFCKNSVLVAENEQVLPKTDPYAQMFERFADHIRSGRDSPTSMDRAAVSTDMVFEVYRQMANGRSHAEYAGGRI